MNPSDKDMAQWLRLRTIREETARVQREAKRREREAVLVTREAHAQALARAQQRAQALVNWVSGPGTTSMAQLSGFASARREALADAAERAEYALIDDDEALAQADRELAQAQAEWMRAQGKTEAARRLLERQRHAQHKWAELRAEREVEPVPR